MKETFGLRLEKDNKEWIMSHSNPQEFMRKLVHQARYPPKRRNNIIAEETAYCYEEFEKKGVDCRFGNYIPEKRKVFCQCTYPSIRALKLGVKNLVDPWICEAHFKSDAFQSLIEYVDRARKQRDERQKEQDKPALTLLERKDAERKKW